MGSGWTMWKAIDETLARSVSVLTFAPGFPRIPEVVRAARSASRLTDPRLAQVFDVEDGDDQAYVVLEWVAGDTLTDLVAEGPLDPARACALVSEAARALAGAHATGLAHLCLTPQSLTWTRSSGVKITGLGIDAALAGEGIANSSDPALTDTKDLAALLYAALTGYWPGESQTSLPTPPLSDGEVCTPRQVSPDVPPPVDAVVTRALLQRTVRHGAPIGTPDAFADAISSVAPPVPLPEPAPPVSRGSFDTFDGGQRGGYGGQGGYGAQGGYGGPGYQGGGYPGQQGGGYPGQGGGGYPDQGGYGAQGGYGGRGGYTPNPDDPSTWNARGGGRGGYQRGYQPTGRSGASRAVISVVVVLVVAAVAAAAWAISTSLGKSSSSGNQAGGATTGPSTSGKGSSSAPPATALTPVSAESFNILGASPSPEDTQDVNKPLTGSGVWKTQQYSDAAFGGLKSGDGYLIKMSGPVKLSTITVTFATPGTAMAGICVGDSPNANSASGGCPTGFTSVSPQRSVSDGATTFTANANSAGQYVVIWFTKLTSSGQESISKITMTGTSATSAG